MSWLLPSELFKPKMFAWCKALVAPISSLHGSFLAFRKQKNYDLSITGQVCLLEKLLNDKFDNTLRRIYIEDGEKSKRKYIFKRNEFVPLPIYTTAETTPIFFYLNGEITTITYHFIANVPTGLSYNNDVMKSVLNIYKLPSRKYKIEVI